MYLCIYYCPDDSKIRIYTYSYRYTYVHVIYKCLYMYIYLCVLNDKYNIDNIKSTSFICSGLHHCTLSDLLNVASLGGLIIANDYNYL